MFGVVGRIEAGVVAWRVEAIEDDLKQLRLAHFCEDVHRPIGALAYAARLSAARSPGLGRTARHPRREAPVGLVVALQRHADLLKIVDALGPSGGLPGCLNGRQSQSQQDADHGEHHQQFDQREAEWPAGQLATGLRL